MVITHKDILYDLNKLHSSKTAILVKCFSNKNSIMIPEKVTDPETNEEYVITRISDGAFKNCENLIKIDFERSDNIEYIGKSAFEGCLSLTKFKIPSKISNVSKRCFYDCVNLKAVSSDSSIKNVEESAFENCKRLKNISKLDLHQLTVIYENAFKNCLSLIFDMKIDTLHTIKENAFDKCRKVRITGNSLNLENGFKYENINSNPQCKWKPSLKIGFLETASLLILILSVFLSCIFALQSWKYGELVVAGLLILICIFMSAVCFSYYRHKKNMIYFTFAFGIISAAIFILYYCVDILFLSSGTEIINNISLSKTENNKYSVSVTPKNTQSDFIIEDFDLKKNTFSISQKKVSEETNWQVLYIKEKNKTLVNIQNNLKNDNIEKVDLSFVSGSCSVLIKTNEDNLSYYFKSGNKKYDLIPVDTHIYKCCIDKISDFELLSDNNISDSDPLLSIQINNSVRTNEIDKTIILFILQICVFVCVCLTVGFLLVSLHDFQNVFIENKGFIVLVLLIIVVIFSIINKDSPYDVFQNIFSSLAGL